MLLDGTKQPANALTGFPGPSWAEAIAPFQIEIVSGDTIRMDGAPVRLLGLNAAETGEQGSVKA